MNTLEIGFKRNEIVKKFYIRLICFIIYFGFRMKNGRTTTTTDSVMNLLDIFHIQWILVYSKYVYDQYPTEI